MDKLPIKNWPEEERPREKLVKLGKENLTSCELLAIIIGTGCMKDNQSYSALDLASSLVSKYKNLKSMLDLSITEISEIKGIGIVKAVQILAAIELGKRAVSEKNGNYTSFRCSEEVANYYIPLMKDLKKEQFRVIMLNIKNKIIKEILISQGSLTSSIVHPREVICPAIRESAASLIFIHNHPSGDPEPSIDDIEITRRLCKSCSIIGINVLDHLIIAENGYFSFKQKDML